MKSAMSDIPLWVMRTVMGHQAPSPSYNDQSSESLCKRAILA